MAPSMVLGRSWRKALNLVMIKTLIYLVLLLAVSVAVSFDNVKPSIKVEIET